MEVLIDRAWKKDGYTISRLYVNGKLFGCNTLEDNHACEFSLAKL